MKKNGWLEKKHYNFYSDRGANQLLVDFAAIQVWIQEKVNISDDIRYLLKTSEILRRCEGVGRLLLREHGESINMNSEKHFSEGTA